VTLTPNGTLAAATVYTVTITALTGANGAALSGTRALHFTTAAAAPQYVVWRYPGGEAKPPTLAFNTPAKPAKGGTVADPVYHTAIHRITDRATDGYASPAIVNEYARADPENADGTRAILRGVEGDWSLYDVATCQRLRTVDFRGNPDAEPRWHPTDPNVVFFVEGASLWQHNTSTADDTLVHDFSGEVAGCAFARTRFEGEPSTDCRYWCLRLEDADYELLRIVCYDRQTDSIVGRMTEITGDWDWVGMDMSGSHCILGSGDTTDAVAYDRSFQNPVPLPHGIGHADVALDAAGHDVLVYQNAATDWIAMASLETGVETNLLPIPFSDNTDIGLHFSGNCDGTPGWVLVSTYGQQATAQSWMDQSLFLLQLQPNPLVWRLAQTFTIQDPALEKDYFGEAFAAINRAGSRVWWGSNWNAAGPANHLYETCTAKLPAGWPDAVTAAAGQ